MTLSEYGKEQGKDKKYTYSIFSDKVHFQKSFFLSKESSTSIEQGITVNYHSKDIFYNVTEDFSFQF